MIKLTAPNGSAVRVDHKMIMMMYPNDGTYHPEAKTVLIVAGNKQAVRESIEEIEKLINGW